MTATERVQQFIGQLVVSNAALQEQVELLQLKLQEVQNAKKAEGERLPQDGDVGAQPDVRRLPSSKPGRSDPGT